MQLNRLLLRTILFVSSSIGLSAQNFSGNWQSQTGSIHTRSTPDGPDTSVRMFITQVNHTLNVKEEILFKEAPENVIEDKVTPTNRPIKQHEAKEYTQNREYSVDLDKGLINDPTSVGCNTSVQKQSIRVITLSWICNPPGQDRWTVKDVWTVDSKNKDVLAIKRIVSRSDGSNEGSVKEDEVNFTLSRQR